MKQVYIKKHLVTGLLYFGITTKADAHKYRGSGKYWMKHIRKHGYKVSTDVVFQSDNQEEVTLFCLTFSKEADIVADDAWANLKDEDGLSGNPKGIIFNPEWKAKLDLARWGNKKRLGTTHSAETRQRMSEQRIGQRFKPVKGTCVTTGQTLIITSVKQRDDLGFDQSSISRCATGVRKTYGGYTWEHIQKEDV